MSILTHLHLPADPWLGAAVLGLALLAVAAPAAYLLLAGLDLEEVVAALRARRPCWRKLVKAAAHAVLFLKLLLL
ncbi:hypothetical protein [Paracraurococcus ruber]|nr:hypothetical protein [Paracraurococcus ruber]TDG30640.1 hypothetical protein E2C05_13720 [Paracraurococcus ruber]